MVGHISQHWWEIELRTLSEIAKSSPHSSYAAFTHGFSSKWTFLCRTCPNIDHLLQPLEKTIQSLFIPFLTGRAAMSDPERHLLNLPVRYGGMGLTNPSIFSDFQYQSSINITSPLVDLILMQASSLPTNLNWVQHQIKKDVIKSKRQFLDNMSKEATINLSEKQRCLMEIASEKGASSWLTVLPIQEHGYHLHKGSFRDALCMRYGWQPPLLPTTCVCHKAFSVEHCLSCPNGGYTIFCHNQLRDVTAQLLAETCHNVTTEPSLQPMSGETLKLKSANREDGA